MRKREKLTPEERFSLALELVKRERSFEEICLHYQVSHTTAYKIKNAFLDGGRRALAGARGRIDAEVDPPTVRGIAVDNGSALSSDGANLRDDAIVAHGEDVGESLGAEALVADDAAATDCARR